MTRSIAQCIARQKIGDAEPVGFDWLDTFRQHFPEEFQDENARVSIERGSERSMSKRPGVKS